MQLCSLDSVKIISFRKQIMLEVVCRLDLCYVNYAFVVGSYGMTISVWGGGEIKLKKKIYPDVAFYL